MFSPPFWTEGPAKVHEVGNVRFQSTLINPIAESKQTDSYPLVIWFCGLGPSGLDGIGVELVWLSRATSKSFVLVAPMRSSTTWWVLNDRWPPWGCVLGSLLVSEVDKYCRWIEILAGASGIDRTSVSLFGASAGAYAVSEIIACGTCKLHCVGLAAVHGHGRPDLGGLDAECQFRSDEIKSKWVAYINRIMNHRTTPNILIGVHTEEDTFSPWKYARDIYKAFDLGRRFQDLPPPTLLKVQPSETRTSHNYGPQAMELFLQLAFGDVEISKRMLASHASFCLPTRLSVPDRSALSSQVDASLVSSSGESFGRHRSGSSRPDQHVDPAVGPMEADHVGTVPRVPVGQDGLLPVGDFGFMTLDDGMQVLYIAHSDTDCNGLWSNALDIGSSYCLSGVEYFDSQDGSAICESVRSALFSTGTVFASRFFCCAQVGDFVAVGFGGNKKKRKRSSRVAAAVCFELQAESPVAEFLPYRELQNLIRQVRFFCNFEVR